MTTTAPVYPSSYQADSPKEHTQDLLQAYRHLRKGQGQRMIAVSDETATQEEKARILHLLKQLHHTQIDASNTLYDDPVFMAWVNFMLRAMDRSPDETPTHISNLPDVLHRILQRWTGEHEWYLPGTSIALYQLDIDPYIRRATPPSYDFDAKIAGGKGMDGQGHPLELQQELTGLAMANVMHAWPDLHQQILDVVKIIGYLPDASFRSCSAARYAGVIYVGNMDERILDIEESIVHEAGHQVLYRLGELTTLVKPGVSHAPDYELPWSGSKRDLFGFLHAFYIYTLLTKYFWRRAAIRESEQSDSVQRAVLIMIGNHLAIPMLRNNPDLTGQGKALVQVLADDMDQLQLQIESHYTQQLAHHA